MFRMTSLLVAVWVLTAAPTLCMGGMLEHPCSYGVDDHDESGHTPASSCDHEYCCQADPCTPVCRTVERSSKESLPRPELQHAAVDVCQGDTSCCDLTRLVPPAFDSYYSAGRRYPDRALPLLI